MKITIYELLGLIKDGKAPKKIKCEGIVYNFEYQNTITGAYEYRSKYNNCLMSNIAEHLYLTDILNVEVEIIEEEKEIETLPPYIKGDDLSFEIAQNRKAINELIDEIKKLKEQKK